MAVVPAEKYRHHSLFFAVLVTKPLFLANARRRAVAPEIEARLAQHLGVREPDRAVMVMVRRAGMAHARERRPGRADQGIEEWSWIRRTDVPAQPLHAFDLKRNSLIRQRNNLAAREWLSHIAFQASPASRGFS